LRTPTTRLTSGSPAIARHPPSPPPADTYARTHPRRPPHPRPVRRALRCTRGRTTHRLPRHPLPPIRSTVPNAVGPDREDPHPPAAPTPDRPPDAPRR